MAEKATPEISTARGRRFLRLFLMAAGGLAAPCLALAAFFLSNSGGGDTPARAAVQSGRVTATTGARTAPTIPVTTSTTTAPAAPTAPARDPFLPLVSQTPPAGTGGTPAR